MITTSHAFKGETQLRLTYSLAQMNKKFTIIILDFSSKLILAAFQNSCNFSILLSWQSYFEFDNTHFITRVLQVPITMVLISLY